jgi:hypothetical protein
MRAYETERENDLIIMRHRFDAVRIGGTIREVELDLRMERSVITYDSTAMPELLAEEKSDEPEVAWYYSRGEYTVAVFYGRDTQTIVAKKLLRIPDTTLIRRLGRVLHRMGL